MKTLADDAAVFEWWESAETDLTLTFLQIMYMGQSWTVWELGYSEYPTQLQIQHILFLHAAHGLNSDEMVHFWMNTLLPEHHNIWIFMIILIELHFKLCYTCFYEKT